MLDLAEYLKGDTPFSIIALAVLYNLLRRAIELYHERKRERQTAEAERLRAREEAEDERERLEMVRQLAAAVTEVTYLKTELERIRLEKEKGP